MRGSSPEPVGRVTETNRRTVTYSRVYGRPLQHGGTVFPFPVDAPIRTVRRDLEAEASADLREAKHEYGDLRITLRRVDWSVEVELDVYVYDEEPEQLEEN